jgi:signal recognition particle receptor subunit beta
MQIKKKTKFLLTTSEDKDVIVAEVDTSHKYNERSEYVVSYDFVKANVDNGTLVDITNKVDWDKRIWIYADDMA